MRKIVTGDRVAIRHGDRLLAVPPMPPGTPRDVRVQVLEYVLRRQPGLAQVTAQVAADAQDQRDRHVPGLAVLLAETPHYTPRSAA